MTARAEFTEGHNGGGYNTSRSMTFLSRPPSYQPASVIIKDTSLHEQEPAQAVTHCLEIRRLQDHHNCL